MKKDNKYPESYWIDLTKTSCWAVKKKAIGLEVLDSGVKY